MPSLLGGNKGTSGQNSPQATGCGSPLAEDGVSPLAVACGSPLASSRPAAEFQSWLGNRGAPEQVLQQPQAQRDHWVGSPPSQCSPMPHDARQHQPDHQQLLPKHQHQHQLPQPKQGWPNSTRGVAPCGDGVAQGYQHLIDDAVQLWQPPLMAKAASDCTPSSSSSGLSQSSGLSVRHLPPSAVPPQSYPSQRSPLQFGSDTASPPLPVHQGAMQPVQPVHTVHQQWKSSLAMANQLGGRTRQVQQTFQQTPLALPHQLVDLGLLHPVQQAQSHRHPQPQPQQLPPSLYTSQIRHQQMLQFQHQQILQAQPHQPGHPAPSRHPLPLHHHHNQQQLQLVPPLVPQQSDPPLPFLPLVQTTKGSEEGSDVLEEAATLFAAGLSVDDDDGGYHLGDLQLDEWPATESAPPTAAAAATAAAAPSGGPPRVPAPMVTSLSAPAGTQMTTASSQQAAPRPPQVCIIMLIFLLHDLSPLLLPHLRLSITQRMSGCNTMTTKCKS